MELIALMIEEELGDNELEGTKPVELEMYIYPRIEDEYPLFSELEPGIG